MTQTIESRLRAHVEALCSEPCAGRAAGSPEGEAARAYVVDKLRAAGLTPELQPVPGPGGANVLARVGAGPARVLIGAHYDHIGRVGKRVFWGADDNAAAVALLLELSALPDGALLVAFDAEEPPHFMSGTMGSQTFVRDPPVPLEDLELVLILDLVGHAVGPAEAPTAVRDSLFVLGAEKSAGTPALVDAAAPPAIVRRTMIDVIPPLSDYQAFREAEIPFLFLTCGRWRHYHEPTDTPDRLDYRKLAGITAFVDRLVRAALARPPGRPAYDDDARDHAGTVATLLDLARAVSRPARLARTLEAIAARIGPDGRCSLSDWSTVLGALALLEQGLA